MLPIKVAEVTVGGLEQGPNKALVIWLTVEKGVTVNEKAVGRLIINSKEITTRKETFVESIILSSLFSSFFFLFFL